MLRSPFSPPFSILLPSAERRRQLLPLAALRSPPPSPSRDELRPSRRRPPPQRPPPPLLATRLLHPSFRQPHAIPSRALAAPLSTEGVAASSYGVPRRRLTGHFHFIQDVVLSSDGQFALSSSWDGGLRLWDLNTGITTRCIVGHTKDVPSVAFFIDHCLYSLAASTRPLTHGDRKPSPRVCSSDAFSPCFLLLFWLGLLLFSPAASPLSVSTTAVNYQPTAGLLAMAAALLSCSPTYIAKLQPPLQEGCHRFLLQISALTRPEQLPLARAAFVFSVAQHHLLFNTPP